MTNKTICIVAPSLQSGGIERALNLLSEHFISRGHKVIYISCRKGKHFFELNQNVILEEPLFVHSTNWYKKLFSYYFTIKFIRKQYKKYKPDTILSFGDIINPLAITANIGLRFPVFISDRISPKQKLSATKNLFKWLTYKSATGIIAQSKQAADYKYQVFGNRINLKIIPNSLNESKEIQVEKQNWIVGVGRLSYEKGFDRLIQAFAKLNPENWFLVIAGDGPEKARLMEMSKNYSIESKVKFLGTVKDVERLLAESKIFVIPSRYEGFPNALCEAMATPLPCISFDSIAAEDLIVNRQNGIIVKDGDIDGLAKNISELINDEKLRNNLAENAKSIRNKLNREKIGDEFLKFILN